jgi:exonuclease SbcC
MKILSVEWKNFASYGNRMQKINFTENKGAFYVVVGHNGAGKSTISDVIKYGLYGRLDNKKHRDIPNRFNGNMFVRIVVEKQAGVVATIERGLSPGVFRVLVNGKDYDQAGKRNVQEFLEEEILGMPYYIFNNIVSLSVNDFKSFLGMSPHDKRQIIDKLFGLEMLGHLRWHVKEHIKAIREGVTSMETEIAVLERTIQKSNEELENLFEKLKSADEEKKVQLIEGIQKATEYIDEANKKLATIEEKEGLLKQSLKGWNTQLNDKKYELKSLTEKQKLYENDCCPTCGSDLHTDFHKSAMEDNAHQVKMLEGEISKINESTVTLKENSTKIEAIKKDLSAKKTNAGYHLSTLKKDLSAISDEDIKDEQTGSLKSIIADSEEKKELAARKRVEEEKKANFFKIIEEVFGDRGVKLSAIKRIMPVLNQEIRKVLKDLNMDYRVTFGEDFSVKILHMGYDVSVDQLSTGERKKIDFAVIIAMIRIMKIKFHGLNLIFLDEIFSSIDSDGIWHILRVLSNTSKELGLHTFVINHSNLPTELFDYRVEIEKKNGFSELNVEAIG